VTNIRVGLGHDRHRITMARPLWLAGVSIPCEWGLDGHSDADVVLHALTDAILGALALGDIGEWFPNTDPQWQGAASSLFVTTAVQAARERGWTVGNVDCTVHAERPKLSAFKPAMAQRLAELLGVPVSAVNVKAKTGERVGPIGRGEAVDADVVVLMIATEAIVADSVAPPAASV
jgi:2-C-methyl-D-erythritol 2,4-cyclodiphosphate synthase